MTRKEQIIEILNNHKIIDAKRDNILVLYAKDVEIGFIADEILALPLDVPGDDEIDAIVYAACKDAYDPDGCVTEAYKLGIKIAINEILKRNTP